jgi:hypothetical protein
MRFLFLKKNVHFFLEIMKETLGGFPVAAGRDLFYYSFL